MNPTPENLEGRTIGELADLAAEANGIRRVDFSEGIGFEEDSGDLTTRMIYGGLAARVPDGGTIPAWHGSVRYNADRGDGMGELITAIIPFNLLLRALWRIVFFVKAGGQAVSMDPRVAYHTGLQNGILNERENAPTDIKLQRAIVEAASKRADNLVRLFGQHGMLQEKQLEFDVELAEWLTKAEMSYLRDSGFPLPQFSELQYEKEKLREQREQPGPQTS